MRILYLAFSSMKCFSFSIKYVFVTFSSSIDSSLETVSKNFSDLVIAWCEANYMKPNTGKCNLVTLGNKKK